MEIAELKPEKYKEWDDFCLESNDAWLWHASALLEYNLNFRPDSKAISKSFFIIENNRIVAICPLILETSEDGIKEFSFSGGYGPVPALANSLTKKVKEKVLKAVFDHIDDLAKQNGVKRISLRFSILNRSFIETGEQRYNYLMKFSYLDNSLNTQIIDLSKPLEELRLDLRHGHDSDIDMASRSLKEVIFDKSNIAKENFDEYVSMHLKAGGVARKDRPRKTFDIMYELIKKDEAFLIGAKKENRFVGFSYFFAYKGNVYYGSSCKDESIGNLPAAHFIQWSAIKWMNQKKYRFYELGWQYYSPTLSDQCTPKEIDISRFKRGFGGFTVSLFRGEKFYDKKYFSQIYEDRIKKLADNLNNRIKN